MICAARIVAGVVIETADIPAALAGFTLARLFPGDAGWQDVSDADPRPGAGWLVSDGAFVPPAPLVVPELPPVVAGLAFVLTLFTAAEQAAVIALLVTDGRVNWFMHLLGLAGSVALTNPLVIEGVGLLASLGAIKPARIPQILAGITADAVAFDAANAVPLT